jgi:hypothetical protein
MDKFHFNFKTRHKILQKEENKDDIIKEILTNLNVMAHIYKQMTEITLTFEDNIMCLVNKVQNEGSISYMTSEIFDNYLSEFINRITSCLKIQMSSQFGFSTEIIKHWKETNKTYKYNATIYTTSNKQSFEQLICEIDNVGIFNYTLNISNDMTITNDIRTGMYNNEEPVIIKFGKNMMYEFKNSKMLNILQKSDHSFSETMEKYITCILSSFHDQINKNNDIVKSSINHVKHIDEIF